MAAEEMEKHETFLFWFKVSARSFSPFVPKFYDFGYGFSCATHLLLHPGFAQLGDDDNCSRGDLPLGDGRRREHHCCFGSTGKAAPNSAKQL